MYKVVLVCLLVGQIVASPVHEKELKCSDGNCNVEPFVSLATNPCDSDPCLKEGSVNCINEGDKFKCECLPGHAGALCQIST